MHFKHTYFFPLELSPSCSHLRAFKYRYLLISEYFMEDGNYVINPEGDAGVQPFTVRCEGSRTVLPTNIGKLVMDFPVGSINARA